MCNNPYCSCCHHAYLEGVADAHPLGFARGYQSAYITGYVDATRQVDPDPDYRAAIIARLEDHRREDDVARVLQRLPGSKPCGCIGRCTCTE